MNIKKIIAAASMLMASLTYGASPLITEVNSTEEFEKLIKSNPQVIVEFYNPTCPVCMSFAAKHIFSDSAQALPAIRFAMVSSQQGALHQQFNIGPTPTFILFKNGIQIEDSRFTGYVDNPVFTHRVRDLFNKQPSK